MHHRSSQSRLGGAIVSGLATIALIGGIWAGLWAVFSGQLGGRPLQAKSKELITMSEQATQRINEEPGTRRLSRSAHDITRLSEQRINELAERLTPEQRRILLKKGTEPAFCGNLLDNKMQGTYCCALCDLPLFASDAKFDSGTGWPSFFQPVDRDHIRYEEDNSFGMKRVEIMCERCGGHLGHVFEDGPRPTGLRYCLNSESMAFFENGQQLPPGAQPVKTETAYFAGGCFWGIEHYFQHKVPGVANVISGYQGGVVDNPTYRQVTTGRTGHAESIKIVFDPTQVSYERLLEVFFRVHDPTTLNRQGPDIGTQYRSAIFAVDEKQFEQAKAFIAKLQAEDPRFKNRRIVTEVNEFAPFWVAEDFHQDYRERHGGQCSLPVWD